MIIVKPASQLVSSLRIALDPALQYILRRRRNGRAQNPPAANPPLPLQQLTHLHLIRLLLRACRLGTQTRRNSQKAEQHNCYLLRFHGDGHTQRRHAKPSTSTNLQQSPTMHTARMLPIPRNISARRHMPDLQKPLHLPIMLVHQAQPAHRPSLSERRTRHMQRTQASQSYHRRIRGACRQQTVEPAD